MWVVHFGTHRLPLSTVFSSYSLFLDVNTLLLSKWYSIRLVILILIFLISLRKSFLFHQKELMCPMNVSLYPLSTCKSPIMALSEPASVISDPIHSSQYLVSSVHTPGVYFKGKCFFYVLQYLS